jgi:hypothetical protein
MAKHACKKEACSGQKALLAYRSGQGQSIAGARTAEQRERFPGLRGAAGKLPRRRLLSDLPNVVLRRADGNVQLVQYAMTTGSGKPVQKDQKEPG